MKRALLVCFTGANLMLLSGVQAQQVLRCQQPTPNGAVADLVIDSNSIVTQSTAFGPSGLPASARRYTIIETSPTHYVARDDQGDPPDEFHVDRVSGKAKYVRRTKSQALDILRDRCDGKISADDCRKRHAAIGVTLDGCGLNPKLCDLWRVSRDVLFETHYVCAPATPRF